MREAGERDRGSPASLSPALSPAARAALRQGCGDILGRLTVRGDGARR